MRANRTKEYFQGLAKSTLTMIELDPEKKEDLLTNMLSVVYYRGALEAGVGEEDGNE